MPMPCLTPLTPLLLLVPAPAELPGAVEIRPGLFIVKGTPGPATFAALKAAGITHVLNLRTPAEGSFALDQETSRLAGAEYLACPLDREPTDAALDAFRARLRGLPKGARALVYCASGNRVAGALFAFWTLDQGLGEAEALDLARQAGLRSPVTEAAVRAYVARVRGRR